MIIINRKKGYGKHRKYILGAGFIDSLSSTLRNVGSYISQNKDLIAKPLLGAVGDLAAAGVAEGGKALLNHIIQKQSANASKRSQNKVNDSFINQNQIDPKSLAILQNMIGEQNSNIPITNIIGSGIKKF
jgi:hypothetical protein